MFRGDKINITENRAVLHTALRAPRERVINVDGRNVVPDVHAVLDKMSDFARRVRDGGQPHCNAAGHLPLRDRIRNRARIGKCHRRRRIHGRGGC